MKSEYDRLTEALRASGISGEKIDMLDTLLKNVSVMGDKLNETALLISDASIVVEYNNGGGQSGIRENPLFIGYEALWKSYLSGLDAILKQFGKDDGTNSKPVTNTVLELVRNKRRIEA